MEIFDKFKGIINEEKYKELVSLYFLVIFAGQWLLYIVISLSLGLVAQFLTMIGEDKASKHYLAILENINPYLYLLFIAIIAIALRYWIIGFIYKKLHTKKEFDFNSLVIKLLLVDFLVEFFFNTLTGSGALNSIFSRIPIIVQSFGSPLQLSLFLAFIVPFIFTLPACYLVKKFKN